MESRFVVRAAVLAAIAMPLIGSPIFAAQSPSRPPNPSESDTVLARFREGRRIELAVRAADRRELVKPAPKGFAPEPADRKLRLSVIPRNKTIRLGEKFWYMLELQNVGRGTVAYQEDPSFLKNGDRYDLGRWDFHIVGPGGKRETMVIGALYDEMAIGDLKLDAIRVPGSETMTQEEIQDYIRRDYAKQQADRGLEVELGPGESLVSRPWQWFGAQERLARKQRGEADLTPRPTGRFREFWTTYPFDKPGRYEITVAYDDTAPAAPHEDILREIEKRGGSRKRAIADYQEEARKRLGRIESPPVTVEIVR